MTKTIAVDFDGTVTEHSEYPVMGKIRPDMKLLLSKLHDDGYRLVLNTCRRDKYYTEALVALKQENMYDLFDWNTENNKYGQQGKLVASFYLDDRSCLVDFDTVDWNWLYCKIVEYVSR